MVINDLVLVSECMIGCMVINDLIWRMKRICMVINDLVLFDLANEAYLHGYQ